MFFSKFGENYDAIKVQESRLPSFYGEDAVSLALKGVLGIASPERHTNQLVQLIMEKESSFVPVCLVNFNLLVSATYV